MDGRQRGAHTDLAGSCLLAVSPGALEEVTRRNLREAPAAPTTRKCHGNSCSRPFYLATRAASLKSCLGAGAPVSPLQPSVTFGIPAEGGHGHASHLMVCVSARGPWTAPQRPWGCPVMGTEWESRPLGPSHLTSVFWGCRRRRSFRCPLTLLRLCSCRAEPPSVQDITSEGHPPTLTRALIPGAPWKLCPREGDQVWASGGFPLGCSLTACKRAPRKACVSATPLSAGLVGCQDGGRQPPSCRRGSLTSSPPPAPLSSRQHPASVPILLIILCPLPV